MPGNDRDYSVIENELKHIQEAIAESKQERREGFTALDKKIDGLVLRFDLQMMEVKIAIAELKIKSGLWGFAAGALPTIVGILWFVLTQKK